MLSVYGMKDELRRPMMLLVKAAIPKNCKEETSKPFSKQKEIRRSLLVNLTILFTQADRDLSRSNRTRRARRFSPYQSEVLLCRSTEGP
jgi:hypothetical protein